jgi:hypothetical protein
MAPYSVGPVYRVLPVSSGSASLTEPLVGFHSPPRRTEHADFPHSALLPASQEGLWDAANWMCFQSGEVSSIYSTSSNRFRLPLPVYPLSQVLQITERFYQTPCLPSLPEELRNIWVPSLPGSYPGSSLLQTLPTPSLLSHLLGT